MKFSNNKCRIVSLFLSFFLFGMEVFAQTSEVKVVFKVNQKEIEVKEFKVSIFESGGKIKLLDLKTKDNKIVVPSEIANSEKFEIHISFDKYELVLLNANKYYFDYEWIIDAVDPPPNNTVENKSECPNKKLKMLYFVNYKPPNSEGGFVEVIKIYENR